MSDHDKSRIFHSILIKDCARLIGGAVVNSKDGEVVIGLRQKRIKAFAQIRSDVVTGTTIATFGVSVTDRGGNILKHF